MIHSFVEGYLRTVEWTSATSYVVLPLKLQYQVSSHREDSTTEFVNIQKQIPVSNFLLPLFIFLIFGFPSLF